MIDLNAFDTAAIRTVRNTTHRLRPLSSLVGRLADRLVPQAEAKADCAVICYCGSGYTCHSCGDPCYKFDARVRMYCSDEAGHCTGIICGYYIKCRPTICQTMCA